VIELLAIIKAVEHQRARRESFWTWLTVPDYTPIIIERLGSIVEILTRGD
jgi:hypothetical protein